MGHFSLITTSVCNLLLLLSNVNGFYLNRINENSNYLLTFPLRWIDHSISINNLFEDEEFIPNGSCEDVKSPDLIVKLRKTMEVPKSLYCGFIESNRVNCLTITDCNIKHIAPGTFYSMQNLHYLDISRNQIDYCELLTFGGLNNLITLVIDENNFINNNNFILDKIDYFPQLKYFYFRKNNLCDIRVSLRNYLPVLTHLYLSDNQLNGEIFNYIDLPTTLSHLHVERNFIKKVNGHKLINLSSLFLDGNQIQTICYRNCFYNDYLNLQTLNNNLKFLSLSNNKISNIDCDSFEPVPNLSSLNLAHNNIELIKPGTFDQLYNLKDLILSYNCLSKVPTSLPPSIISLSLDNNFINTVSTNSFCNMYHLKWLSLANNKISCIETNAFVNLYELDELDLSSNELSYLPINWIGSESCLRHLDLRNNRFTNIQQLSLGNILTLTHIYIQGNFISDSETSLHWQMARNVTGSSSDRRKVYLQ